MGVDASKVKELREMTGARMKDCVTALKETDGDMEKAVAFLRTQNLAKGEATSARTAEEGSIGYKLAADGSAISLIQLSANTDFVVKNDEYKTLVNNLLEVVDKGKITSADELNKQELGGRPVEEVVRELAGKIGENIAIKQVVRAEGAFGYYVHHDAKQGAVVELEGIEGEKAQELGKDLAMHVVFAKPKCLTRDEVSEEDIAKEKAIVSDRLKTDPKNAKKPAEILEKIAVGQLNKFFGQVCMIDQPYYKENKKTVTQILKETGGPDLKVKRFVHLHVGVA